MYRGDQINFQLPTPNFQAVGVTLLVVLAGASAQAHRLDEYLQSARVDLDLTRVEVRLALTPGVDVAEIIISEIDADHDGVLSSNERTAYVSHVLDALHVDVDGHAVRLLAISSHVPAAADLRGGEESITIRAGSDIPALAPGAHRIHVRNTHHAEIGAYLANALVPQTRRIEIKEQQRNPDQSDITIDYVVRAV